MTAESRGLRIGVVLEAFGDWPLEQVLPWLRENAPEITDIEVGAGGYAPHPHCDVAALLASGQARSAWVAGIARHGIRVDALNAWGNPLHPDRELARRHDQALRDAIRLATLLGVSRVVALAGCPGGTAGDRVPHFGAGGWLPYLEGVYQRQWEEQNAPYWAGLAEFAVTESPDLRVCLELHPGTCVFNVETFGQVAALGPVTALERQVYEMVLLDTLVHELNTVRGLLGEPTRLEYASLAMDQVTVMLRFGNLPVAIHWVDLPGIARYGMEFALYAPERRLCLTFPSPFLRNEPTVLEIESGTGGSGRSWRTGEIAGYESGFKRGLEAFHECIVTGATPITSGADGLRDIALCQAIIDSHHRRAPVDDPADTSEIRTAR